MAAFSSAVPTLLSAALISVDSLQATSLKLYSLQGRYATALFNAASKTNRLKEVDGEMQKIKTLVETHAETRALLENPSVGRDVKRAFIDTMCAKHGYSDLVVNLFRTMSDYSRLDNTLKIVAAFEQLMKDHNSEVHVKIVSHKSLSQDVKSRLESLVQKKFVAGDKKPSINWAVDDKIMGGLVIEVGDNVIDMSVATKAAQLNKEFLGSS